MYIYIFFLIFFLQFTLQQEHLDEVAEQGRRYYSDAISVDNYDEAIALH